MKYAAAVLYAISGSTIAALILGFGGLSSQTAVWALIIGACLGALSLRGSPKPAWAGLRRAWSSLESWEWAAVSLFTLFSLRAFLWLVFRTRDSICVLSPNNLGDMSLHLNYIRHLASGIPFWPDNTIVTGAKLAYPLGMDLFNSLLCLAGADLIRGLIWTGLTGCILTGITLWRWGGAFTLAGFLCNGGLLGFSAIYTLTIQDFQAEAAWKNIPLALFVTQRGLLFALPAGLALLSSWKARFPQASSRATLPFAGELLLYASMPLFHLHTFLFLSFVLGFWFVCVPSIRRHVGALVAAAFLPASALVWMVTGMLQGGSMLGWNPGWMQGEQNFFIFWLTNFGALPILTVVLCAVLWRHSQQIWPAAITAPALLIFTVCCFVKFAPWPWDNTKLMIWAYLAILPTLWSELIAPAAYPLRVLCCVTLFFSGFVSLLGGLTTSGGGYEIAQRSELDVIGSAIAQIPPAETFAAAPDYNHPLILSGRKVVMGYEGHVWSHGYELAPRKAELEILMDGNEGWRQLADQLHVRYLFWGPRESARFPSSRQPWKNLYAPVKAGYWGAIYDLNAPAAPTPETAAAPIQ